MDIFFRILTIALLPLSIEAQAAPDFSGSDQCRDCHQQQHQQWLNSDHYHAMLNPDAQSIKGDFANQTFTHKNTSTRFHKDGERYLVTITEPGGKPATYPVAYTFGHYPLQQYLLDIGSGRFQAYDVAWDSRPKAEGGQRWYKLLPEENTNSDSPLHWSRQLNNWNSRCAECHSTGLDKGFNPKDLNYNTTYAEINVACEACHGPGEEHIGRVNSGDYKPGAKSGFTTTLPAAAPFTFKPGQSIAEAVSKTEARAAQTAQVNACGGCHSRRQIIAELDPAKPYHDQYHLSLPEAPLYHADGQIREEVFVLGSYMQSKMYEAGVTCTHCHDAHSGELTLPVEAVCSQCHLSATYATPKHHKHPEGTPGSQCVNCHMPETVYMGVDARRDHGFSIPRSSEHGGSSACSRCHDDSIQSWAKEDSYTQLNAAAAAANPRALRAMGQYISSDQYPAIRRATLLAQVDNIPSQLSLEIIQGQLTAKDPLVRRAAVEASGFLPADMRWKLLRPLLDDSSQTVQFAAATQLAPMLLHLQGKEAQALQDALNAQFKRLEFIADMPSGQAAKATLALAAGDSASAITALETAIELEPSYVPAMLNLADIYRQLYQPQKEAQWLERALALPEPDPASEHAYGLHLIRQKENDKALNHLRKATEIEPTNTRFYFVYAVALDSQGKTEEAINVLKAADQRWPEQFETMLTLVQYLEKADRESETWPYLSRMSAIAPNHPEVRKRVSRLQQ